MEVHMVSLADFSFVDAWPAHTQHDVYHKLLGEFQPLQQDTPAPTVRPTVDCECPTGAVDIDLWRLSLCLSLMVVNGFLSYVLSLGLIKDLTIATIRCVGQLLLVGQILVPVFELGSPWPVLGISVVMMFLASVEARSKPQYQLKKGMLQISALAIFTTSSATTLFGLTVVLDQTPFYNPQYLIPTLGMLLGQALVGVSLGFNSAFSQFYEDRQIVEAYLAKGASKWEASLNVLRRAIKTGISIVLNQMNVIGIVSIPGMMTGQILGGTPPEVAARYQIMIMFLIAFNSMTAIVVAMFFSILYMFDTKGRLRVDRLRKRDGKRKDLLLTLLIGFSRVLTCGNFPAKETKKSGKSKKASSKSSDSGVCCFPSRSKEYPRASEAGSGSGDDEQRQPLRNPIGSSVSHAYAHSMPTSHAASLSEDHSTTPRDPPPPAAR